LFRDIAVVLLASLRDFSKQKGQVFILPLLHILFRERRRFAQEGGFENLMIGLLQDGFEDQAIRAMLWEFARITDHTIISNQFLIVSCTVIGDGMRRAGIMAAGLQFSFSVVR